MQLVHTFVVGGTETSALFYSLKVFCCWQSLLAYLEGFPRTGQTVLAGPDKFGVSGAAESGDPTPAARVL